MYKIPNYVILTARKLEEIDNIIRYCDTSFEIPISERINYQEILVKLYLKGNVLYAYNGEILGYCAFYANDLKNKNAFISLIAINLKYKHIGLGTELLKIAFNKMRSVGMENCLLEVRKSNIGAIKFYKSNKFFIYNEGKETYTMKCQL